MNSYNKTKTLVVVFITVTAKEREIHKRLCSEALAAVQERDLSLYIILYKPMLAPKHVY